MQRTFLLQFLNALVMFFHVLCSKSAITKREAPQLDASRIKNIN